MAELRSINALKSDSSWKLCNILIITVIICVIQDCNSVVCWLAHHCQWKELLRWPPVNEVFQQEMSPVSSLPTAEVWGNADPLSDSTADCIGMGFLDLLLGAGADS